ncbi:MAG: hypothetical protein JWM47_1327, partial [Acidimicrobiales bacterium]|nr:hypothetical protein [Acidimicrobiales bacterium]
RAGDDDVPAAIKVAMPGRPEPVGSAAP